MFRDALRQLVEVERVEPRRVVDRLADRVPWRVTAFEFKHYEPAVGIDSKQVERTVGGLKLPTDECQAGHEHLGVGNEGVFKVDLVVDLWDVLDGHHDSITVSRPQLDPIGH